MNYAQHTGPRKSNRAKLQSAAHRALHQEASARHKAKLKAMHRLLQDRHAISARTHEVSL